MIPVQLCGHNATQTLVYVSKKLARFHWRCSDSRQLYAHFFRRLIALSLPVAFPALKAGFFSKNFWCEREMAEDVNDHDDLHSLMLLCWTTMNFALASCQKFLPFFMLSFRNRVSVPTWDIHFFFIRTKFMRTRGWNLPKKWGPLMNMLRFRDDYFSKTNQAHYNDMKT